jgi:hypothetical protein
MDEMDDETQEAAPITWDIRREGRAWTAEEFTVRANRLIGLDFEISGGKLFWSEETRQLILGMLLENVGMDATVRLGDLAAWKEAIAAAERERKPGPSPDQ